MPLYVNPEKNQRYAMKQRSINLERSNKLMSSGK